VLEWLILAIGTFTLSVDRYLFLGLLPQPNKKRETHFSEVGCAQLRGVSVRFLTFGVVTPITKAPPGRLDRMEVHHAHIAWKGSGRLQMAVPGAGTEAPRA
jgi:hypothetical protein